MATTETDVFSGVFEDENGAQILPKTKGKNVIMEDGTSAEQTAAAIRKALADAMTSAAAAYLSKNTGGSVGGPLDVAGAVTSQSWGSMSTSSNGGVLFAENAYLKYDDNTIRYKNTHANMGARGIFMHPSVGVLYFDTGSIATTKDAAFSPEYRKLDTRLSNMAPADLNTLTDDGFYNGSAMTNAPGTGWFYILVINHSYDKSTYCMQMAWSFEETGGVFYRVKSGDWKPWQKILTNAGGTIYGALDVSGNAAPFRLIGADHIYLPFFRNGLAAGRSAYLGYENAGNAELALNNEVTNGTVHIKAAQGLYVNGMKVPNVWQSTAEPAAAQGADGDVWHQYV